MTRFQHLFDTKMSRAVFWSVASIVACRGLYYVATIGFMFFFDASEYGVYVLAFGIYALTNTLSNLGFDAKLISTDIVSARALYGASFSLEVCRGLFVFGAVISLALLGQRFVSADIDIGLCAILGLSQIFIGLRNPGFVEHRKKLRMQFLFVQELSQFLTFAVIGLIGVAVIGSIYAIAVAHVCGSVMYVVSSYTLHRHRPWFDWSGAKVAALFDYGKWIMISGQIHSAIENGFSIFVGSVFGTGSLGLYDRADQLTRKPLLQVIEVVWRVMFPMLANVKRRSDLSVIYRDLILMTAFGTFAVGIALVVIIPPALRAASLDQWLDIVPLLVWFVAWAGLALNGSINSIVMQALDAPQLDTYLNAIRLCGVGAIALFFSLTVQMSILGLVKALVILQAVLYPISFLVIRYKGFISVNSPILLGLIFVPGLPLLNYGLSSLPTGFSRVGLSVLAMGLPAAMAFLFFQKLSRRVG